jgi:hypothetical protein
MQRHKRKPTEGPDPRLTLPASGCLDSHIPEFLSSEHLAEQQGMRANTPTCRQGMTALRRVFSHEQALLRRFLQPRCPRRMLKDFW